MKSERILYCLGEIREDYIAEAAETPARRGKVQGKWMALVACFACLLLIGGGVMMQRAGTDADLPLLTVTKLDQDAMGFEGYMAFSVDELCLIPTGAVPELLPVYQNQLTYTSDGRPMQADWAAVETALRTLGDRLGMNSGLPVTDNAPDAREQEQIAEKYALVGEEVPEGYFEPTALILEDEQYRVEMDASQSATIVFKASLPPPEGITFSHYAPKSEMLAAADWLSSRFSALIGLDNPQTHLTGGDYDIYRRQSYRLAFSAEQGSYAEQLVSRCLQSIAFYPDDEGKLFLARINSTAALQWVGDYPVLTVDEARAELLAGRYLTNVPEAMPGESYIAGVELGYRGDPREAYAMPYYRFYVELPNLEREDGLKTYGAFYVPAVEGKYLANMEVWDGSFN